MIPADDEARAPAGQFVQQEAPQSFQVGRCSRLLGIEGAASQIAQSVQTEESIRFDPRDGICVHGSSTGCPVLQVVAATNVLPLRMNFAGTRATGIVQVIPGVPPTRSQPICTNHGQTCSGGASIDTAMAPDLSPSGTNSAPGNGPLVSSSVAPHRTSRGRTRKASVDHSRRRDRNRNLRCECHGSSVRRVPGASVMRGRALSAVEVGSALPASSVVVHRTIVW